MVCLSVSSNTYSEVPFQDIKTQLAENIDLGGVRVSRLDVTIDKFVYTSLKVVTPLCYTYILCNLLLFKLL
jgi:hypothetical protein